MTAPAYLLLGPESGQKEQRLKEIRNNLRKEIGGEPELHRFYPFETENGEIFAALDNNSLFADYRLVLLSQAETMNASLTSAIASYLAHPSTSATLVIISSSTSLPAKITKAVPRDCIQVFYELDDSKKTAWVHAFFRHYGQTITGDAVRLLLDLVENNTQEMRTVCSQLALFWQAGEKQGVIGEEEVETYIHHSRQEDAFTLFPEIAKGDFKMSIDTLHSILGSGDSGAPILLVSGLLWQFRRLLSVQEAISGGLGEYEAFGKARVLGKSASIRNRRDKASYHNALQNYDLQQCRAIIRVLSEADIQTKEWGADMAPLLLERMIYRIMVKKGEPLSSASFATFVRA